MRFMCSRARGRKYNAPASQLLHFHVFARARTEDYNVIQAV